MGKYEILASNLVLLTAISLLLTFAGFVILQFLYQTKNKLLTLGASMIIGPLGFLLVLSLGSYIFQGPPGILLMFLAYLAAAFWVFLKDHNFSLQHPMLQHKVKGQDLAVLMVLAAYLGLIFLFAHRSFVGSDSDIYFSIATSFAKGNYPVVQSWQPQFLTVYHQGTYLLEGAFWALSGRDIELVHYFFSVYLIWAIFLLLTGLAREKTRSVLCLLPAVFGLILVGGPVLLTKLSSLSGFISSLSLQPDFTSFQSSNGAGVTNLATLIYTNFYTFGLAVFLIFGLLFLDRWQKDFSLLRYLVLLTIIILGLSIDETFFPAELALFGALLFWQLRKVSFFKKVLTLSVLSLFFSALFILVQNPIRDSLLTPSPEGPRFKVLIESNIPIFGKSFYYPGEKTSWNGFSPGVTAPEAVAARIKYASFAMINNSSAVWVRPDIRLVLGLLLLALIIAPSRWGFFLLVSSFLSYLLSLVVINTFWPPNGLRITNQAFQLGFIGLGFVLFNLLSATNPFKRLAAIAIILLLIPQFLSSHTKPYTFPLVKWEANSAQVRNNFTKQKKDADLENISRYIPPGKVTIFLDRYPDIAPFSYLNYTALTKMGVFVPIAPPKIKILKPAPGVEWLDAVNDFSPYALKELSVEYAYIQNAALSRLSADKIKALNDERFFEKVRGFGDDGILYKVKQGYLSMQEDPNSLKQMSLTIGKGKKVYLDKLKFSEVRKALILELAKTNNLIGYPPAHGGDFYMYIETLLPFEAENPEGLKNLDYVITDKDKDPKDTLPGNFEKILINNYVSLWEKVN